MKRKGWSEVCVDGIHLEHVLEFKYLGCVLDKSGTDEAECSSKVASRRKVSGLMLRICSLSVLGSCKSHCWCLFLHMVVKR